MTKNLIIIIIVSAAAGMVLGAGVAASVILPTAQACRETATQYGYALSALRDGTWADVADYIEVGMNTGCGEDRHTAE